MNDIRQSEQIYRAEILIERNARFGVNSAFTQNYFGTLKLNVCSF